MSLGTLGIMNALVSLYFGVHWWVEGKFEKWLKSLISQCVHASFCVSFCIIGSFVSFWYFVCQNIDFSEKHTQPHYRPLTCRKERFNVQKGLLILGHYLRTKNLPEHAPFAFSQWYKTISFIILHHIQATFDILWPLLPK